MGIEMESRPNTRTGFHGLPAEYRTPDGERESWAALNGYLQALERSQRPVVVATADRRLTELHQGLHAYLTKQIGFLRRLPIPSGERPHLHRFGLNWPDPEQSCGGFLLDERLIEGASLSTNDGDDYFGLRFDLGEISLLVLDSNTNMDHAYHEWSKRQHRNYLSLPSAREIEEKWRAEPNREFIRAAREELGQLRNDLAEQGAAAARNMTDAELEAASNRVAWHLQTSGRMSNVHHGEWKKLWFDDLVANLIAGADSA